VSHLFSARDDMKFPLSHQAKISDKGTAASIFARSSAELSQRLRSPDQRISRSAKTGSLYNFAKITDAGAAGTWFTQEVIANATTFRFSSTTKVVTSRTRKYHSRGHFAIQQHGPAKGGRMWKSL